LKINGLKYGLFVILIITGCILVTGCVLKPTGNGTVEQTTSPTPVPIATVKIASIVPTEVPALGEIPDGIAFGKLNVSIGTYNARLPVYVDNMSAGQVSGGKMLNLKVGEGIHSVKVCTGQVCEMVSTEVKAGVKTTIDFEDRLDANAPQGSLMISIGTYQATLPVYVDNMSAGTLAPGKPVEQMVSQGEHVVKVCNGDTCFSQKVTISASNQSVLDFGERLKNDISQGQVTVSIGGYNAVDLPVQLDGLNVGNVSLGKPLDLKTKEGNHTVSVCAGMVCEKEDVKIKFGKPAFVDFGDRLKADVEFPKPTVRISSFLVSGQELTAEVEFINPDKADHTMSATVSCVYSFVDDQSIRRNDVVQKRISVAVDAGTRHTEEAYLYLGGGSSVIPSDPVIINVEVK
jgi:hypothetical protein